MPSISLSLPSRDNMFSIEGIDGAGKTTQAHALVNELNTVEYLFKGEVMIVML